VELIKVLSEGEIEQIRDRTEEVLETVGLRVEHPVLRRQCREAGAAVDESAER
jgi:trimethylamine:corrinoid methyltransferase-like protein